MFALLVRREVAERGWRRSTVNEGAVIRLLPHSRPPSPCTATSNKSVTLFPRADRCSGVMLLPLAASQAIAFCWNPLC
jgi:hypothetical protein